MIKRRSKTEFITNDSKSHDQGQVPATKCCDNSQLTFIISCFFRITLPKETYKVVVANRQENVFHN